MSINSSLNAIQIIGQRRAFCRHRILASNCVRRESVLVPSRNGEKNHATCKNSEWTCHKNEEVEQVQPVQMNNQLSNNYKIDLTWLQFDDEPGVQKRQQKKEQQSYQFLYLIQHTKVKFRSTSPDLTTVLQYPSIHDLSQIYRDKEQLLKNIIIALFHSVTTGISKSILADPTPAFPINLVLKEWCNKTSKYYHDIEIGDN